MNRFYLITAAVFLNSGVANANPNSIFQGEMQRCIIPAAQYHGVNEHILWAILKVESNFKPSTVTTNDNGTNDFGMGGMNTINMPKLQKHGIGVKEIKDPCVSTYVAAWHLRSEMEKHGNTWYGIAAYHSATPYFNNRYQILLKNALKDAGVLAGKKEAVPPLRPGTTSKPKTKTARTTNVATNDPAQLLAVDF